MTPEPASPVVPDFATWTHENLAKFALEAYLKMQDQRELIEHLRHLVATTPNDQATTRKAD